MKATSPAPAAASFAHIMMISRLLAFCSISVLVETQEQKVIGRGWWLTTALVTWQSMTRQPSAHGLVAKTAKKNG
ncbi:MAG: hypothetical protein JO256_13880 [Alphaproteobacteria bacterium]|nr:hypothetical protein [Alphaproteobacteria bacterium]